MDHGTPDRDDQVTWEIHASLRQSAGDMYGDPAHQFSDAPLRCQRASGRHRRDVGAVVGRAQGEPERRPKEVWKSEGCIRAMTAAKASDDAEPPEQKAARVDVNLRREPWPMHGRRNACHRDCSR